MALTISRTPTVYSLSQLAGEGDGPSADSTAATTPSSSPASPSPARRAAITPSKAVHDLTAGASLLPLYSFPAHDGFQVKRVRSFGSFGDLQAAAVPDTDDPHGCGWLGAAAWARARWRSRRLVLSAVGTDTRPRLPSLAAGCMATRLTRRPPRWTARLTRVPADRCALPRPWPPCPPL